MQDPTLHGTNHTVMYIHVPEVTLCTSAYNYIYLYIHVPRFLFPAMNQHNEAKFPRIPSDILRVL